MDTTTLFLGIGAMLMFAFALFLWYVTTTNSKLAKLVPPEALPDIHKLQTMVAELGDKILLAGLQQASTTDDLTDDQLFITGIRRRGGTVSGSPETGYTASIPPHA